MLSGKKGRERERLGRGSEIKKEEWKEGRREPTDSWPEEREGKGSNKAAKLNFYDWMDGFISRRRKREDSMEERTSARMNEKKMSKRKESRLCLSLSSPAIQAPFSIPSNISRLLIIITGNTRRF